MYHPFHSRLNRGGAMLAVFAVLAAAPMFAQTAGPKILLSGGGSYLGVGLAEVDSQRAGELKLKEERGVEITSVAEDSPAEKAGIKKGDVVLDYNGTAVLGIEQFARLLLDPEAQHFAQPAEERDIVEINRCAHNSESFHRG